MTTTTIMKKLAQRMSHNVQTFPDPRQREAIVTDMLLGVIKTGELTLPIPLTRFLGEIASKKNKSIDCAA